MSKPGASTPGGKRGRPFPPGNRFGHQWKPGESGNPSGMPKTQAETARYIAERLREEETLEGLITALKVHAIKGSPTHIVEALNRVAGKVTDKQDVSVDLGPVLDAIAEAIKDIPGAAERIIPLLEPLAAGRMK
jgi:hypothetical protein